MAVTDTDTVQEIVTDALREAKVVGVNEPVQAEYSAIALRTLNRMVKGWQNKGYNLWTVTSMSVAATTNANYTLGPVRPHKILSVNYKNTSGIELPMQNLTRQEYDDLPNKSSSGIPTTWYFDRQREAAVLYVWPVLSSVTTETLEITYNREIEDMGLTDTLDMPGEWYEAVVYNLALRLCNTFSLPASNELIVLAGDALQDALSDDREESVWFGEVVY